MMLVMGVFTSYTLQAVLDMPYSLFVNLFTMAERFTMLSAEMVMLGRHMSKDPELANKCSVFNTRVKVRKTYKAIANADAKAKAHNLARGYDVTHI